MIVDDQAAVIAFLGEPATHAGASVERIDTHASIVFLAADRAHKLKRAVRFDYLDFSTVERRRAFCESEVRLNRRTAPTLYRGVVAVTREPGGSLAIGGSGPAIDWLVEMNRFDQALLLDRRAADHRLTLELMPPLADSIAEFHRAAEPRPDHGGHAGMSWVIAGNAEGFTEFGAKVLDPSACQRTIDASRLELDRRAALLEARCQSGFVRQCHGDLHLRNIVLLDGRPTIFDGVEFNDRISCTDVFYDLAFLLMDLWHRRLPRHANVVLNRYIFDTDDLDGLSLLPLFLSCRAAVRAKTSATGAQLQSTASRRKELEETAGRYLAMAERLLHPPRPSLVAIGGFSGSGKSTLARALAPLLGAVPGALVLRSDEIRKQLIGVSPLEPLGAQGYSPSMSERVYRTMIDRAANLLRRGHSVVVDAVSARARDRTAIEQAAARASVPFAGLWLDAPEATLAARAEGRRGDVSDADAAVVRSQVAASPGPLGWQRLDASTSPDDVLELALSWLRGTHGDVMNDAEG